MPPPQAIVDGFQVRIDKLLAFTNPTPGASKLNTPDTIAQQQFTFCAIGSRQIGRALDVILRLEAAPQTNQLISAYLAESSVVVGAYLQVIDGLAPNITSAPLRDEARQLRTDMSDFQHLLENEARSRKF
jgi:hypothetical protein